MTVSHHAHTGYTSQRSLFSMFSGRLFQVTAVPDDSFGPVVARNSEVLGSNPDRDGYLSSVMCSKLSKGLECAVLLLTLCTIKNPWSHSRRVEHSPEFGPPSFAILPWLCWKRRKAIITTTTLSNTYRKTKKCIGYRYRVIIIILNVGYIC